MGQRRGSRRGRLPGRARGMPGDAGRRGAARTPGLEDGMSARQQVRNQSGRLVRGGCLCGAVRFEFDGPIDELELCHCPRCRKATGSAFLPSLQVPLKRFRFVSGEEVIRSVELPLVEHPPPYLHAFCGMCGSPSPFMHAAKGGMSVPAGSLDDDPAAESAIHIYPSTRPRGSRRPNRRRGSPRRRSGNCGGRGTCSRQPAIEARRMSFGASQDDVLSTGSGRSSRLCWCANPRSTLSSASNPLSAARRSSAPFPVPAHPISGIVRTS